MEIGYISKSTKKISFLYLHQCHESFYETFRLPFAGFCLYVYTRSMYFNIRSPSSVIIVKCKRKVLQSPKMNGIKLRL